MPQPRGTPDRRRPYATPRRRAYRLGGTLALTLRVCECLRAQIATAQATRDDYWSERTFPGSGIEPGSAAAADGALRVGVEAAGGDGL